MSTVAELLRRAECLPGDGARREGEILLGHCLQKPRTWLYAWPEADVAPASEAQFAELLSERARGVPVAYLTGRREFWSLELAVNEHTLIPRPETETLVQWALDLDLPDQSTVLDLGTGSGAIALALARERPSWRITAVDTSREALAVARENGRRVGLDSVRFLQSDWFGALTNERFDLIVSNPPYVAEGDPHLAVGDLRFEPASALVAAQSGLADLARIVAGAIRHLGQGGWLLLEHGSEQGEPVRQMLEEARFARVATRSDLAGLDRVSGGCRHAE